jgi:tryptophan synthase alpha chain
MNRINEKFQLLQEKNEKALVGFITAGDPDMEKSIKIIKVMIDTGLDILELGVPFSDPSADGPVIQRSSARALASGTTLEAVLDMTKKIRKMTDIPIILFTYYNPVFVMGSQKFCQKALSNGADGVLIVDLPLEESDELTKLKEMKELFFIRLVSPTTPKKRMTKIAQAANGFIYLISKTGVTGSCGLNTCETGSTAINLRSVTSLPICTGFGISTPGEIREVAAFSDGVVIGSAFEKIIETNIDNPELYKIMAVATAKFKEATKA